MSDTSSQPEALLTSLRRIDWLSIAPWSLLFRVPRIALGKPFLIAAVGSLLISNLIASMPIPMQPKSLLIFTDNLADSATIMVELLVSMPSKLLAAIFDPREWFFLLRSLGSYFAWAWIGLAIIEHALRALIPTSPISLRLSLLKATKNLPTMLGVFSLVLAACLPFSTLLILAHLANQIDLVASIMSFLSPLLTIVGGLPLFLLIGGFLLGTPLSLSAIVIDQADMFDASSRMFAYTFQRLGKLFFYIITSLAIGLVSFLLLNLLLQGVEQVMHAMMPNLDIEMAMSRSNRFNSYILQSYSAAYFFTVASAIYLLLRQDVDNQPLDEISTHE